MHTHVHVGTSELARTALWLAGDGDGVGDWRGALFACPPGRQRHDHEAAARAQHVRRNDAPIHTRVNRVGKGV